MINTSHLMKKKCISKKSGFNIYQFMDEQFFFSKKMFILCIKKHMIFEFCGKFREFESILQNFFFRTNNPKKNSLFGINVDK